MVARERLESLAGYFFLKISDPKSSRDGLGGRPLPNSSTRTFPSPKLLLAVSDPIYITASNIGFLGGCVVRHRGAEAGVQPFTRHYSTYYGYRFQRIGLCNMLR